eukprot:scaffold14681_cov163-Skeletonema_dohrnii-CCMP3373.AAC.2
MFSADLISNNSSFAMIAPQGKSLVALWYTCDAMPQICPRMSGPLDCLCTKGSLHVFNSCFYFFKKFV